MLALLLLLIFPQMQSKNRKDHLTQEQKNVFRGVFNFLSQAEPPKSDIGKDDLKAVMRSLHMNPTDAEVAEMMKSAGGDTMNFTSFCNLMGNELKKLDSRMDLSQAFECFDIDGVGTMSEAEFREILAEDGDFTDREVREFVRLAGGDGEKINYNNLVDKMLGDL
jgi:Ca2+-binding EF-hand superfamily protein